MTQRGGSVARLVAAIQNVDLWMKKTYTHMAKLFDARIVRFSASSPLSSRLLEVIPVRPCSIVCDALRVIEMVLECLRYCGAFRKRTLLFQLGERGVFGRLPTEAA